MAASRTARADPVTATQAHAYTGRHRNRNSHTDIHRRDMLTIIHRTRLAVEKCHRICLGCFEADHKLRTTRIDSNSPATPLPPASPSNSSGLPSRQNATATRSGIEREREWPSSPVSKVHSWPPRRLRLRSASAKPRAGIYPSSLSKFSTRCSPLLANGRSSKA